MAEQPSNFMKTLSDLDNNTTISLVLSVFLVVYAALLAPMLPGYALGIFDNPIFRLLAFLVIAYTASKNPVLAILGAIAMLVSMNTIHRRLLAEKVAQVIEQPVLGVSNETSPVSDPEVDDYEGAAMMVEGDGMSVPSGVPDMEAPVGTQPMVVGNGVMGTPSGDGSMPVASNEAMSMSGNSVEDGSLGSTGMLGYTQPQLDSEGQGSPLGMSVSGGEGCPSMTGFKSAGWPQYASMDAGFYKTRESGGSVPGYNITDERFKYAGVN